MHKVPTCEVPGCHGHLSKFDDCLSEAVWSWSMDVADREAGSCDFQGHYALVAAPEAEVFTMDEGQSGAYPVPVLAGHYVVFTMSGGAVSVTRFETAQEAAAVMDAADEAYGEWLGDDED